MAKSCKSESNVGLGFETLDTYEAITKKLEEIRDKLIIILFNVRFPDRFSLETRMKYWVNTFEETYDVQFFKCTVTDGKQDIKDKYGIEDPPAVIFFRNGKQIGKINDFEESNLKIVNTTKPNGKSNDEEKLKNKIIELKENK